MRGCHVATRVVKGPSRTQALRVFRRVLRVAERRRHKHKRDNEEGSPVSAVDESKPSDSICTGLGGLVVRTLALSIDFNSRLERKTASAIASSIRVDRKRWIHGPSRPQNAGVGSRVRQWGTACCSALVSKLA